MGKRIADDLDRRRGAPRNGAHLTLEAQAAVAQAVATLTKRLGQVAADLELARLARGDREWRRECLTRTQRDEVAAATARVRAEAREWAR